MEAEVRVQLRTMLAAGLSVAALTAGAGPAAAGEYAERLARCLVRSAADSDRTSLKQWFFAAALADPALQPLASISPAQREDMQRAGAAVMERLITVDCRKEAVAAIHYEHGTAPSELFKTLVEVAGRDLLSNGEASAALRRGFNYVDRSKLIAMRLEAAMLPEDPAGRPAR